MVGWDLLVEQLQDRRRNVGEACGGQIVAKVMVVGRVGIEPTTDGL